MSFFNRKENDIDALKNKGLALSELSGLITYHLSQNEDVVRP
jgi:hypothetical protein